MKSIVQPIAVWERKAPSHSICALMLTDDQRTIVTGSQEGQICLWNLSPDFKTLPRIFLFGHTSSVTSLGKASEKQPYIVSAAENGEMCLWNVTSGQCIEHTKLPFTHTAIYYYYRSFRMSGDGWLLCCGQYQDVLVIDARSLELLHALVSSTTPDWISSMCIVHSQRIQEDSLVGISVTGDLKVWDLSSSVNGVQARENVFEAESKSLQCFNCQAVCFCTYTERLLLVVCSDCWKVFDYCDFSLLCFVNSSNGHHWAGGEVLAANKIIIWTENGHSYIYQLPDSSLFKAGIFTSHGHSLSETVSPRLLCYTSNDANGKRSRTAILIFINERKEPFHKILFCGEASGTISMWHIPDVPTAKRDGSPQEIQIAATLSLQGAFEQHKTMTEEITDQLGVLPNGIQTGLITASVYIPNLDNLVCGCENGRIIITLGLHAARAQLLVEHSLLKAWLPHRILVGHCAKVTCLLHPFNKSATFDTSWLVSGDEDSNVIWWNMFKGEVLHKFVLHAGPVLNLSVCPEDCSVKVQQSVCCLANDNSVALLSLQYRTCLMHARKHLSPVKVIKWRPAEDLLVVGCDDGAVYVWDIETGTLDRHETGDVAKAIIGSCDDASSTFMNVMDSVSLGVRPLDLIKKKNTSYKQSGSFKFSTSPPAFQTTENTKSSEKVTEIILIEFVIVLSTHPWQAVFPAAAYKNVTLIHLHLIKSPVHRNHPPHAPPVKLTTHDGVSSEHCFTTAFIGRALGHLNFEGNSEPACCLLVCKSSEAHRELKLLTFAFSNEFAFPEPTLQPFTVLPVKTKWSDSTIHVLLFDISTICEQLLSYQEKEPKLQNTVQSHETLKRLTNIDGKKQPMSLKRNKTTASPCQANGSVKDLVREHLFYSENNTSGLAREGAAISKQKTKPKRTKRVTTSAVKKMDVNMARDTAKLLISCLFPWGVDRDLDELCMKHLGMFEPRCPVSFGLLSQDDYLSLLLPGWYQVNREMTKDYVFCSKISNKVVELAKQVSNITQAYTVSVEETLNDEADGNFQSEMTSYLLSVILLVNIQMRMPFLSKGNEMHYTMRLINICNQLELASGAKEAALSLGELIASWQVQSVELLEAIQAMLLSEVQRVFRALRKKPISRQPMIRAQNGNSEPQTVLQTEQIELQDLQQNTSTVMLTYFSKAVTGNAKADPPSRPTSSSFLLLQEHRHKLDGWTGDLAVDIGKTAAFQITYNKGLNSNQKLMIASKKTMYFKVFQKL
ncbi:WD repeat-containing protein 72-like [Carcharodon carcharias]|uniref:WD repeat-containing protein 72-like n=1 Tax=Carcharodon carcharias TaxID=13397 RepID=UPI001B7DE27B|nr:WD repeat-containing protein 72-like [Carcharodon carcharias]